MFMNVILALLLSTQVQDAATAYIDDAFGPHEINCEKVQCDNHEDDVDYSEKCDMVMEIDGRSGLIQAACFIVVDLSE